MQDILIEEASPGTERINRINYEICVLQALRDRLRCKEIWVDGADRFRNPDDDLPSDFSDKRTDYYSALKQPMDVERFIDDLQQAMGKALTQFDANLPTNPKVRLRTYGKNRLVVTPLEPQAEPVQLVALKEEIARRWPMTSLLDIVKETDLRVGFTRFFRSVTAWENLDRETLHYRLLLTLYGIGTGAGLKRVGMGHPERVVSGSPVYPPALYQQRALTPSDCGGRQWHSSRRVCRRSGAKGRRHVRRIHGISGRGIRIS